MSTPCNTDMDDPSSPLHCCIPTCDTLMIKFGFLSIAFIVSDPCDPGLSLSPGRSVMAEPDYLEGDCDELIKPKKLINPVKNSRNHQDLHRELLMNQKRSGDRRKQSFSLFVSCLRPSNLYPGKLAS